MLSLHGENEIEIKVKMINNEIFTVGINKGKSVFDLKEEIRRKINIPVVNQKLIFQGKVLKDNDGLSVYKLENDDVIHLIRINPNNNNDTNLENEQRNPPTLLEYLTLLSMMNNGINTNLLQLRNQINNNNNNNNNNINNIMNNKQKIKNKLIET